MKTRKNTAKSLASLKVKTSLNAGCEKREK